VHVQGIILLREKYNPTSPTICPYFFDSNEASKEVVGEVATTRMRMQGPGH